MFRKKPARLALVGVLTAFTGLMVSTTPARADEYTDLLDILRAKGSLTQSEYQTLLNRRSRSARRAPSRGAPAATVSAMRSSAPALTRSRSSASVIPHSPWIRPRRCHGSSGSVARSSSTHSAGGAIGTRSGSGKYR